MIEGFPFWLLNASPFLVCSRRHLTTEFGVTLRFNNFFIRRIKFKQDFAMLTTLMLRLRLSVITVDVLDDDVDDLGGDDDDDQGLAFGRRRLLSSDVVYDLSNDHPLWSIRLTIRLLTNDDFTGRGYNTLLLRWNDLDPHPSYWYRFVFTHYSS